MTIVDANVLLYAYNADAPRHSAAAAWLTKLFRDAEIVGFAWVTIWAFIRISTNQRIWPNPKSGLQALEHVREWLAHPEVVIVHPGVRHLEILEDLIGDHRSPGPSVSDAVLAALALEYGATVASTDRDFGRFSGLRWVNPLD